MDDHQSRQQIDELAELYLTSLIDNAPTDEEQDEIPAEPAPSAENPIAGPPPIRLTPKLDTSGSYQGQDDGHPMLRLTEEEAEADQSPNRQELDALVAMAEDLTSSQRASLDQADTQDNTDDLGPKAEAPAPQALLEAVLMGNLPGMSGPWLTQYAQLLAQSQGPVLILHLAETSIDLELVEPRLEAEPAPTIPPTTVRIPPMREGMTGLVGLIDALVTSKSTPARTILVRMEDGTDTQNLSRLAAIHDWTLLCGADDASVAGMTRHLRTLAHADPRLADRSIGLMVMGSEASAAKKAVDHVAHELEDDLVHPIKLIGHLKRMQPVQVRDIGSFADPVAVWPQLVSWFETLETPEPIAPREPDQPEEVKPVQQINKPAAAASPAASSPKPRPSFRTTPPKPTTPTPDSNEAAPVVAQASEPTRPAPTPRVLNPQPELDLVALLVQGGVKLDDPITLEARIPDQPNTQLVVDALGQVHILTQHVSESSYIKAALMEAIEAGRWAQAHIELLALTERERTFVAEEPVVHLLTDRADQAVPLAGKVGSQVRLHLLQQVQVGKATGWFCTPLG